MTSSGGDMQVRILTLKDVAIPISARKGITPEVAQLRADFLAGKELSREDLGTLLAQTASRTDTNLNCVLC